MSTENAKDCRQGDVKAQYSPTEYCCDFCGKPESVVGELIMGRNKFGRDFQFCQACKDEKQIKFVSDIEPQYAKLEKSTPNDDVISEVLANMAGRTIKGDK